MKTSFYNPHVSFEFDYTVITQFVIYDKPRDFPGKYVIRKWQVKGEKEIPLEGYICDTLQQARSLVEPLGLVRLVRCPGDDPAILEVWI